MGTGNAATRLPASMDVGAGTGTGCNGRRASAGREGGRANAGHNGRRDDGAELRPRLPFRCRRKGPMPLFGRPVDKNCENRYFCRRLRPKIAASKKAILRNRR